MLRKGDDDLVEITGGDASAEDLARLLEHLADVIAGGDVDEGEHRHVGLGGDRGGLADRRVAGFGGALGLLLGEAGVVDEELGVGRAPPPSRGEGAVSPVTTTVRPARALP